MYGPIPLPIFCVHPNMYIKCSVLIMCHFTGCPMSTNANMPTPPSSDEEMQEAQPLTNSTPSPIMAETMRIHVAHQELVRELMFPDEKPTRSTAEVIDELANQIVAGYVANPTSNEATGLTPPSTPPGANSSGARADTTPKAHQKKEAKVCPKCRKPRQLLRCFACSKLGHKWHECPYGIQEGGQADTRAEPIDPLEGARCQCHIHTTNPGCPKCKTNAKECPHWHGLKPFSEHHFFKISSAIKFAYRKAEARMKSLGVKQVPLQNNTISHRSDGTTQTGQSGEEPGDAIKVCTAGLAPESRSFFDIKTKGKGRPQNNIDVCTQTDQPVPKQPRAGDSPPRGTPKVSYPLRGGTAPTPEWRRASPPLPLPPPEENNLRPNYSKGAIPKKKTASVSPHVSQRDAPSTSRQSARPYPAPLSSRASNVMTPWSHIVMDQICHHPEPVDSMLRESPHNTLPVSDSFPPATSQLHGPNKVQTPRVLFPQDIRRADTTIPEPTVGITNQQLLLNCSSICLALRCENCGEAGHRADTCRRKPTSKTPLSPQELRVLKDMAHLDQARLQLRDSSEILLLIRGYARRNVRNYQWQSQQAHVMARLQGAFLTTGLRSLHLRYLSEGGLVMTPSIDMVQQENATPESQQAYDLHMSQRFETTQNKEELQEWKREFAKRQAATTALLNDVEKVILQTAEISPQDQPNHQKQLVSPNQCFM